MPPEIKDMVEAETNAKGAAFQIKMQFCMYCGCAYVIEVTP